LDKKKDKIRKSIKVRVKKGKERSGHKKNKRIEGYKDNAQRKTNERIRGC
jgi:hypothetical protein